MTNGKTDRPKVGHVLRYVYLFEEEARQGRDEGVKERFVVVVGIEGNRYHVAAITTKGEGQDNALLLPAPVAKAGGISSGSAVVVSEKNAFTWLGFDIRPISKAQGYIAGRLPPSFTDKLIGIMLDAKDIDRD